MPSILGMLTSVITRSNFPRSAICSASQPSAACSTWWPALVSVMPTICRIAAESSTAKIFAIAGLLGAYGLEFTPFGIALGIGALGAEWGVERAVCAVAARYLARRRGRIRTTRAGLGPLAPGAMASTTLRPRRGLSAHGCNSRSGVALRRLDHVVDTITVEHLVETADLFGHRL